MIAGAQTIQRAPDDFGADIVGLVGAGSRLAGLFGSMEDDQVRLIAVLANSAGLTAVETSIDTPPGRYPSVTPAVPAAGWYERELRDLFGLAPQGHPRPSGLVLPQQQSPDVLLPRPGSPRKPELIEPSELVLPKHVGGLGVFSIPYGPVRSGIFEAVEFLLETPGEEILHVRPRVYFKHRGIEKRFEGLTLGDGVMLAERVEGISSVAHALAYCSAVERLAGVDVPPEAACLRALYAELERLANHLDVVARLTEPAGLAVALARFSQHKERTLRLVARLCGSRFGRSTIVPGGVAEGPKLRPTELRTELDRLEDDIRRDSELLMRTASFLDRVRGTGVISPETAVQHGALGPIGRGSGISEDVRASRPYAAYEELGFRPASSREQGDALARLGIRWDEIWESFRLIRAAIDQTGSERWSAGREDVSLEEVEGWSLGWAEAAQGEVLYLLGARDGRIVRCKPRSASFHNLALFPAAFQGDILTDFAFIEASFGLSIAGVAC